MSTEKRIQKDLEKGKKLTVLKVFQRHHTFELKRYIYLLRKAGMLISDKWESNGEKRWKVYWLAA